jgi:hypothetical protein
METPSDHVYIRPQVEQLHELDLDRLHFVGESLRLLHQEVKGQVGGCSQALPLFCCWSIKINLAVQGMKQASCVYAGCCSGVCWQPLDSGNLHH